MAGSSLLSTSEVKIFSRDMQMSLTASTKKSDSFSPRRSKPATAPSQAQLAAAASSSRLGATKAKRAEEYGQYMSYIVDRARRQTAESQAREDRVLQEMLRASENEEAGFVKDVGRYIDVRERSMQHRKHTLCKEWQDKVFETIQRQIDAEVAKIDDAELGDRKRALMDAYIRTSNTKTYGLYRDIIIESEYDPLTSREHFVKYRFNGEDPLKQELKRETGASGFGGGERDRYPGRETLDCRMWNKLESTPYGRFSRVAPPGSQAALDVEAMREHGGAASCFDHYHVPTGQAGLAAAHLEFPRSKKTFKPTQIGGVMPSSKDKYDMSTMPAEKGGKKTFGGQISLMSQVDEVIFGRDLDGSTSTAAHKKRTEFGSTEGMAGDAVATAVHKANEAFKSEQADGDKRKRNFGVVSQLSQADEVILGHDIDGSVAAAKLAERAAFDGERAGRGA